MPGYAGFQTTTLLRYNRQQRLLSLLLFDFKSAWRYHKQARHLVELRKKEFKV